MRNLKVRSVIVRDTLLSSERCKVQQDEALSKSPSSRGNSNCNLTKKKLSHLATIRNVIKKNK